jgi:hypothetical protein
MNFLTQLHPRRFHSARTVWRLEGGNEDNDLWALNHETGFGQGVSSVFVPTDAQRQMIADGYNICLTVIGGQPPVLLRLTDEPIGKAPQPEEKV